jgi:hypothetical protein
MRGFPVNTSLKGRVFPTFSVINLNIFYGIGSATVSGINKNTKTAPAPILQKNQK